jgi:hypothetical protein
MISMLVFGVLAFAMVTFLPGPQNLWALFDAKG